MNKKFNADEKTNKVWISITGYRILLILKSLMEKDCTVVELSDIIVKNPVVNKPLSKDTIRVALNTLKSAGCEIKRPTKANAYKYELIKHPFYMHLSEDELELFLNLREKISLDMNIDDIFVMNDLYEKLVLLTNNDEQIVQVDESKPLKNINKSVLSEINNPKVRGKKLQIKYLSPVFGEENLDIIPQKVTYENGRVYLWCYIFKYNKNSLLDVARIININSISISEKSDMTLSYEVEYEVFGNSVLSFEKKEYEEVIVQNEQSIKVKAYVENEFLFIQRILLFGADFKIISPDFFKEKLISKIKLIQKGYEQ